MFPIEKYPLDTRTELRYVRDMNITVNGTTPFGALIDYDKCSICGGVGSIVYGGGCWECDPSIPLEYSPVRASFVIVDGAVSEVRS